ncbi:MAG: hypothetical protein NT137_07245 [Methanomassiliicoccales archaeon]|nr:hypothetical protein [Methanomassiliicoccales archaeon]
MKNSIDLLIPGLSMSEVGKSSEVCTEMPLQWLLKRSHVILWADRIYVPRQEFETPVNPMIENRHISEAIERAIDELKKLQLIKPLSDDVQKRSTMEQDLIERLMEQDENILPRYLEKGENDGAILDMGVVCGGIEVCRPRMRAIYGALMTGEKLDAGVLFDDWQLQYLERTSRRSAGGNGFIEVNAFDALIPSVPMVPEEALYKRCLVCPKPELCGKKIELASMELVTEALETRDRPEVKQLRDVIRRTMAQCRKKVSKTGHSATVPHELRSQLQEGRKLVLEAFPKMQRWTILLGMVSAPMSLIDFMPGGLPNPFIATTAAVSAVGGGVEILKQKYSWITYLDQIKLKQRKSTDPQHR